jgi:hypothetical protein
MSANLQKVTTVPLVLKGRALWFVAPVTAMVYPLFLMGFHTSISAANIPENSAAWLAWIAAGALLILAFAAPLVALLSAMKLSAIEAPTMAELRARRVAFLAVASPPIFTFVGVVFYMLGISDLDMWVLFIFLGALAIAIAYSDKHAPVVLKPASVKANIRTNHGIVATGIVLIFLGFHLANHFFGLISPDTHAFVMKALRHIYRAPFVEPLLLAGFLFQIISGFYLAWQLTSKVTDSFRTFQIASGIFLIFFIISHTNAVFVFARVYLNIDPGWGFATGAPAGLIHDAWNIRLVPLYGLAMFFVLSHLAAGARVVMLAHGRKKEIADGVMIWGAALSALASALVLLGMCGLRLHFA